MAGRFYLGPRTGSGMTMRIMRNPADNPATTARTAYDKFAFDSESGDLAYAYGINANPAGMGIQPIITSVAQYDSGWWDIQGWWSSQYNWGGNVGKIGFGGIVTRYNPAFYPGEPEKVASVRDLASLVSDVSSAPSAGRYLLWQLPATSAAPPFPFSSGGVSRIYKSGSQLRVPRSSFAANNGNPNNFILHEAIRPVKVVSAGRVRLNGGGPLSITLPGPSSTNLFVSGHFSEPGQPVTYPYVGVSGSPQLARRVQYRVLDGGRTLQVRERSGVTVDLSYFAVAEDNSGPTYGDAPFLTSGVDSAGTSFLQIRRPGCSSSPSFADILVDSRWQAMSMIANGWVSAGAFGSIGAGGRQAAVSIPTLGFKPLVLANWLFSGVSADGEWTYVDTREGCVSYGTNLGEHQDITQFLGDTSYVTINDGSLVFTNYFENPLAYKYLDTPPAGVKPIGAGALLSIFSGVRYYAFAIPQG